MKVWAKKNTTAKAELSLPSFTTLLYELLSAGKEDTLSAFCRL